VLVPLKGFVSADLFYRAIVVGRRTKGSNQSTPFLVLSLAYLFIFLFCHTFLNMFFGGDPFEHFGGHGHGGGGGGPGGARRPRADVDTTKLYETLGIDKSADEKEIKKAFRKLA
jgi:hypothetical protein